MTEAKIYVLPDTTKGMWTVEHKIDHKDKNKIILDDPLGTGDIIVQHVEGAAGEVVLVNLKTKKENEFVKSGRIREFTGENGFVIRVTHEPHERRPFGAPRKKK